jgi:serine/threonine protein kinase/predicted Zn-dependent protease
VGFPDDILTALQDRDVMEEPGNERWQQLEALVDAALDLPAAEREVWLRAACATDAALYQEVIQLLEAGERPDAFLEPLITLGADLIQPEIEASASLPEKPLRVGPYRIVRELGRGGMGIVYLAEREEHFQQQVALKVIRRGLHVDEHLLRRFVEERQMLATLEHPNIARLLDGGMSEDGVPWFAMEYVEGEPIDRWCDGRRLAVEARLELFGTACDAIEYAHRRHIVHRDIKPSNVLVRADGTVKLLDFGVAKLVTPDRRAEAGLTRTGVRLLTPEYASPEQVRGGAITAASDVYSLGVLLYELLTGRRPYRVTGRASNEVENAVLTQDPARPSTVVKRTESNEATNEPARVAPSTATQLARARGTTPDRLSERLRGELDSIALKALAKEPADRYESAAALATDVQRHLDGQPVRARSRVRWRTSAVAIAMILFVAAATTLGLLQRNPFFRTAPASPPPVLAVGLISDYREGNTSALARPLADLLATNLARVPSLRVVSTARLYELMAQLGAGDEPDAGAYAAAARRAGASTLVDGSLYGTGSASLRLDLRRIDVSTGDVLAVHTVLGSDVFALVDSGTVQLAADIGVAAPGGSVRDVTTDSEVAYRFYEEGLRAYYRGDQFAARGLLQAALAEDSTMAMAAYYLARSYESGELNTLWMQRALMMAMHASDREQLIIRSAWAVWTSDRAALAIAESLTVRYPHEVEGHVYAARALAEAGDYSGALARMRQIVATDSLALAGVTARCAACDARNEIVSLYVVMDSFAAARREALLWTTLEPDWAKPWERLAQLEALFGHSEAARDAYQRAASIDPSMNGDPETLAVRRLTESDFGTLDRELREIVQSGSPERQLRARWFLIISLRRQGRLEEALEEARTYRIPAARATPSAPPEWFALHQAQVLFELGRHREAAALFDTIANANIGYTPSHRARHRTWVLSLAGNALAAGGDTATLAPRIDTVRIIGAQSLLVRDPVLHHHLRGLLLLARGNADEAVREFYQALFAPAGYTRVNYDLARALLHVRRPQQAVAVLQPAARGTIEGSNLYVTSTELHELLAQAWDAAGTRDSALVHYRAVLHAWRSADPVLRDRVASVRARVAALEATRPSIPPNR